MREIASFYVSTAVTAGSLESANRHSYDGVEGPSLCSLEMYLSYPDGNGEVRLVAYEGCTLLDCQAVSVATLLCRRFGGVNLDIPLPGYEEFRAVAIAA